MQTQEIWKGIPGYLGMYEASTFGRIKSLERTVIGINGIKQVFKGRIRILRICTSGYYYINLAKNGKIKTRKVHQLIAESFLNHKPNGHNLVVNHINFNRLDNRLNNIEIITHRENSNQKHIKTTSKYVGVYQLSNSKKWRASIGINGKSKYLGTFNTELGAHKAYQNKLNSL